MTKRSIEATIDRMSDDIDRMRSDLSNLRKQVKEQSGSPVVESDLAIYVDVSGSCAGIPTFVHYVQNVIKALPGAAVYSFGTTIKSGLIWESGGTLVNSAQINEHARLNHHAWIMVLTDQSGALVLPG